MIVPLLQTSLMAALALGSATAPEPEQRPVETTLFGDTRIDPYVWMRDLEDPATLAHVRAENAYTDAVLAPLTGLRDALHDEMLSRVPEREEFPPEPDGAYEYYEREEAALEYPIHCRRRITGGPEEIVLDLNALAEGHDLYAVTGHAVSADGTLVAYLEDTNGDDVAALRVRSIDGAWDREIHPEVVSAYALAWSADGSALYYTRPDATQRPCELWRHRLGEDPGSDVMLLREEDGRFWAELRTSRSGEWIFALFLADDETKVFGIDASDSSREVRPIIPERAGVRVVEICHRRSDSHAGWFYAVDDADGARDGRFVRRRADAAADDPWEVLLPEQPRLQIRTFAIIRDWIVFEERRDGQRVIRVVRHDGSDEHVLALTPRPGFAAIDLGPEYERATVRIVTSGPVSPFAVYEYDPEARTSERLYQRKAAFVLDGFEAGVIHGEAPDGARIPVTYLKPRDIPLDGSAPALLTGYGGYGVILEPGHHVFERYASLLERGVTIAIAHPRGGGFYGKRWHDQGRLEHVPNRFTDFVTAAEALFAAGFTRPESLALFGNSAGGLLVGGAMNLRPDIATVVVAEVPFVDCLNSMLDPSIPVTTLDYPEHGNPADDETIYRALRSYAPYENVGPRDYPDLLAIGGLNDARTAFWEPAKWVARVRERRLDDGVTLLRMRLGAGHGGSSGRTDALEEAAEWQAFILTRLGHATPAATEEVDGAPEG